MNSTFEVLPGSPLAGIHVALNEKWDEKPVTLAVDVPGASRIMVPSTSLQRVFGSELMYENFRFFLPSSVEKTGETLRICSYSVSYPDYESTHFYSSSGPPFPIASRWTSSKGPSTDIHYSGLTDDQGVAMPVCVSAAGNDHQLTVMRLESGREHHSGATGLIQQIVTLKATREAVLRVFTDPDFHKNLIGVDCHQDDHDSDLLLIDSGAIELQIFDRDADKQISGTWILRHPQWEGFERSTLSLSIREDQGITMVRMLQSGVPLPLLRDVREGWTEFYWSRMGLIEILSEVVDADDSSRA